MSGRGISDAIQEPYFSAGGQFSEDMVQLKKYFSSSKVLLGKISRAIVSKSVDALLGATGFE